MTLHGGGGGGGILSSVTDTISNALGTAGGQSGILGGLADFDDAVASSVKGGWGGVAETAAIIAASTVPVFGPVIAAGARGVFDYTHGGEDRENALRNAGEQLAVSAAGSYGGPLASGATKAGLNYTHGGKDRENALLAGAIAGATQAASQGLADSMSSDSSAPITDNSDYTYSPDYVSDAPAGTSSYGEQNAIPEVNAPEVNAPQVTAPEITAPSAPEVFNDGYNPNVNPDILQVPGIAGLQITPPTDSYLGALPTGVSDSPTGYQFEGPNGTEIVGPNGKTYLVKDLEAALNSTSITAPADVSQGLNSLTSNPVKSVPYDPMQASQEGYNLPKYDPMQASQEGYNLPDETVKNFASDPGDPAFQPRHDISKGVDQPSIYDKIMGAPQGIYEYLSNTPVSEMGSDLYNSVLENPISYGAGALGIAGLAGQGPLAGLGYKLGTAKMPSGTTSGTTSDTNTSGSKTAADYKYGSAGNIDKNYLLRNRINAENVYSNATGYRPITRMAGGGEIKHFGLGGISDSLTKVFQPIEKAVVQPIGQAAPFLKDALPYAGMIAAPFIASPIAAAGVGALASGMGQGGFNMRRALMGGISAYGMSNLGGGLEAAGNMTPLVETEGVSKSLNSNNFFRDPSMMAQGAQNLTAGGNTYDLAAKNFATRAGLPSAGMAIMGQSGVSAVNEGIAQKAASDQALAQSEAAQSETYARNQSAKQRAFDAIHAHPYQYAMGGMIPNPPDDQTGMANQTPMQNFEHGGILGYAMGGYAMGGEPRFLSGGGDGMSDSIHANIEGSQEARLADGEFVVPADVVSGLGNGSSKAGAKQLYSMMDRVRQARTGTKKQGKQINPHKLMAV
jgi:hypothetical protein